MARGWGAGLRVRLGRGGTPSYGTPTLAVAARFCYNRCRTLHHLVSRGYELVSASNVCTGPTWAVDVLRAVGRPPCAVAVAARK